MDNSDKWEYVVDTDVSEEKLIRYGQEGWELTAVFTADSRRTLIGDGQHAYNVQYYFKRKLIALPDSVTAEIVQHYNIASIAAELAALKQKLATLQ